MQKKHYIRGREDGELYWEHLTIGGHPGRRNDLVPEGYNVLDSLTIHQVRSAFSFDNRFVSADGVVAVLEVEADGHVGIVLEEDITDGTVDAR